MFRQKIMIIMMSLLCFGIQGITDSDRRDTPANKNDINMIETLWHKCELTWDEAPDYGYFVNAYQRHYNNCWEDYAAYIVSDYVTAARIENEQWELKQIYHYKDDIYQVYTESDMKSELYILFSWNTPDARPWYIIAADIRKTGDEDVTFWNGEYSYNSMLEWYSYEKWFDGEADMQERIDVDMIGDLYDSTYGNHIYYAIFDYLDRFSGDKKIRWEIEENTSYVGRNGEISSMSCIVGTEKIILFLDVWNERYAVLK